MNEARMLEYVAEAKLHEANHVPEQYLERAYRMMETLHIKKSSWPSAMARIGRELLSVKLESAPIDDTKERA